MLIEVQIKPGSPSTGKKNLPNISTDISGDAEVLEPFTNSGLEFLPHEEPSLKEGLQLSRVWNIAESPRFAVS